MQGLRSQVPSLEPSHEWLHASITGNLKHPIFKRKWVHMLAWLSLDGVESWYNFTGTSKRTSERTLQQRSPRSSEQYYCQEEKYIELKRLFISPAREMEVPLILMPPQRKCNGRWNMYCMMKRDKKMEGHGEISSIMFTSVAGLSSRQPQTRKTIC